LRATEVKLEDQYVENYNLLLPLYPATQPDPAGAKSDLETVVKKAATGIGLHTVGNWTDDNYLLMGEAQYYKRDYETAEATFEYIRNELNPKSKNKSKIKTVKKKGKGKKSSASSGKKKKSSASKKKKSSSKKKKSSSKKKKKKSSSKSKKPATKKPTDTTATPPAGNATQPTATTKPAADEPKADPDEEAEVVLSGRNPYDEGRRTSAWPEAMIWYGRVMIEREKYEEADFLFRSLWDDPWFPKELRDELATAEAHLWIKQKRYDNAIPPLTKAIEYSPRKERARLAFILSQLQQRAGQYEQATASLQTVMNSKPTYDMGFNARLRQVESSWNSGTMKSAEATRTLERMAKDSKNAEFRDQIYYVLGSIALEDRQRPEAIAYLQQSLRFNVNNPPQRSETYLKLADLYFEQESFVNAKAYYDSTLTVLAATDERHPRVTEYAKNLTDIARLIRTVADNDSIIRVYKMSPDERIALAKKIKKDRDAAAAAAAAAAPKLDDPKNPSSGRPQPAAAVANAGVKPSTFYFYSEANVKKGKKDFSRVWGNDRKLEDNWRRSQKTISGGISGDEVAANTPQDSARARQSEEAALNDIFKTLPRTDAELAVLHLNTYESLYKLGGLFRDQLQNYKRSVGTLEDLQQRYPDTLKYQKETWYYCFLNHTDLKNTTRAKYYYDLLVEKYPNSAYARAISDPNFMASFKERDREINKLYEDTYAAFQRGEFQKVSATCKEAPRKYGSQHPNMPKFALLAAMSSGNTEGNEAYCKGLSEVIAQFPSSPEATRAKEIARLLSCKGFETAANDPNKPEIDESFTLEDDKLHYFLIVLKGNDLPLEDIKNAISDYNQENHRSEQIRLSNIYLGTTQEQPILVLRKFDNREAGLKYLRAVEKKRDYLGETSRKTYEKEYFIITQENYRRVLKNKTLDGYREFFANNYLKKK
jgi:TolA-binding protein